MSDELLAENALPESPHTVKGQVQRGLPTLLRVSIIQLMNLSCTGCQACYEVFLQSGY
jgi:hypothetical protein